MFDSKEISFDVKKKLGILSVNPKGYTMEANIVSWNGFPAKLDLRQWTPDTHRPMKGITLSENEARKLSEALKDFFEREDEAIKKASETIPC